MKTKCQEKNKFNILLFVLLLMQPILDIYKNLVTNKFEIFGISIIEIINITLVGLIVLYTIKKNFLKIKQKKFFLASIVIGIIYISYIVLHLWNIMNFKVNIYPNHNINIFIETYYLFRAYLLPLILMICIIINGYNKNDFYHAINIFIIMVCFTIVLTNIFNVSYISYSEKNKIIEDNIFGWFTFKGTYFKYLTSKGLFFSANQLSNLLVILLPINIYNSFRQKSLRQYLVLFVQLIAMFMLGTKIACFGSIGICLGFIFLRFIMVIKEKKINSNCTGIYAAFLLSIPIFLYSPLMLEIKYNLLNTPTNTNQQILGSEIFNKIMQDNEDINDDEREKIKEYEQVLKQNNIMINKNIDIKKYGYTSIKLASKSCNIIANDEDIINYMINNYDKYNINLQYINAYSIKNDPLFWCNKFKQTSIVNGKSRALKNSIFNRIVERNNRIYDKYLGLGYTLNMLDTETDYYLQYYQFGIIGTMLLTSPYIIILLLGALSILKNLKDLFNTENILLIVSVFCGLAAAYFGGHFFSYSLIMFPLSTICAIIYLHIIKGKENK